MVLGVHGPRAAVHDEAAGIQRGSEAECVAGVLDALIMRVSAPPCETTRPEQTGDLQAIFGQQFAPLLFAVVRKLVPPDANPFDSGGSVVLHILFKRPAVGREFANCQSSHPWELRSENAAGLLTVSPGKREQYRALASAVKQWLAEQEKPVVAKRRPCPVFQQRPRGSCPASRGSGRVAACLSLFHPVNSALGPGTAHSFKSAHGLLFPRRESQAAGRFSPARDTTTRQTPRGNLNRSFR